MAIIWDTHNMESTHNNMTLENVLSVLRDRVVNYLDRASYSQGTAILLGICWIISLLSGNKSPIVPGAKFHGYTSWFEPSFLLKIRFVTNASNIIESGYKKVRYRK